MTADDTPPPQARSPLLSCPWCDSLAGAARIAPIAGVTGDFPPFWRITCDNGDCVVRPYVDCDTKAEAIAAWNKRAPAERPAPAGGRDE